MSSSFRVHSFLSSYYILFLFFCGFLFRSHLQKPPPLHLQSCRSIEQKQPQISFIHPETNFPLTKQENAGGGFLLNLPKYSRPLCFCVSGWQGVWSCPVSRAHPLPLPSHSRPRQASLVPLASQVEGGKHGEGLRAKRRRRRCGEIDELGL